VIWGMWEGIVGRIRTQLAEWDIVKSAADREQRALDSARQLDAAEVGHRADARSVEGEPPGELTRPSRDR